MIIDHELEFAWNKALSGGNTLSKALDFGQERPTSGRNTDDLYVVTTVKEDVGGELQVEVQTCATESGDYSTVAITEKVTAPKAGTQLVTKLPEEHLRYLKVKFTGATSGKASSFITRGYGSRVDFKQAQSVTNAEKAYDKGRK